MRNISNILIANRGEIAVRIIRTAKKMGLKTFAVFSDADENAIHTKLADKAIYLGGSLPNQSYLNIKKIIKICKKNNIDAVHPGYGFLSENLEFNLACQNANIIFIGPPANAMKMMANKSIAKQQMNKINIPCIEGDKLTNLDIKKTKQLASKISYPLMIKAAAGGGGKGMRIVNDAKDLISSIKLAASEAENSFGNGELLLERLVKNARHIEVQVFADSYGNVIHLGERECSIQRRNQKIIEETPSPIITKEIRNKICKDAIKIAKAIKYQGAGTIEFLIDDNFNHFFLEMNTRLQVEHAVTEAVTGLDLVKMQINIASGEPLKVNQNSIKFHGHSIEVRLCAEDVSSNFLPSTGKIIDFSPPKEIGLRIDSGIDTGLEISSYYDSLLAKLIVHGQNRKDARLKLLSCLQKTKIFGPHTNRDYLISILKNQLFIEAKFTTKFLEDTMPLKKDKKDNFSNIALAACIISYQKSLSCYKNALGFDKQLLGWSSSGHLNSHVKIKSKSNSYNVKIQREKLNHFIIDFKNKKYEINISRNKLLINGKKKVLPKYLINKNFIFISKPNKSFQYEIIEASSTIKSELGSGAILSPMHGRLLEVFVKVGDKVNKGSKLAILEAMKLQHEIQSDVAGEVKTVFKDSGSQVIDDEILFEIKS